MKKNKGTRKAITRKCLKAPVNVGGIPSWKRNQLEAIRNQQSEQANRKAHSQALARFLEKEL